MVEINKKLFDIFPEPVLEIGINYSYILVKIYSLTLQSKISTYFKLILAYLLNIQTDGIQDAAIEISKPFYYISVILFHTGQTTQYNIADNEKNKRIVVQ